MFFSGLEDRRPMRVARHVVLSADQQHFLASVAKARRASARSVERAWIVLLAGAGLQDQQIAARLNITPETAARWRNRFLDLGLMALFQNARPGRPPTITPAKVQEVIRKTTQERAHQRYSLEHAQDGKRCGPQ
jgi:Winged helix-turn helix